ncbi:MAG: hypothetical protein JSU73_04520 [candidate division WOR-3 bacterium]|nr:MAG: hypothetical protein JSU73_04520 [candidate division WOR-3 bacterium]
MEVTTKATLSALVGVKAGVLSAQEWLKLYGWVRDDGSRGVTRTSDRYIVVGQCDTTGREISDSGYWRPSSTATLPGPGSTATTRNGTRLSWPGRLVTEATSHSVRPGPVARRAGTSWP